MSLTLARDNVVREDQYGRDPTQLPDARLVSAVRRRDLFDGPLSRAGRLRSPHLRLLRRRDVRQDRRDGPRRQEGLPRRNVEPTRHVHRHRWVSFLHTGCFKKVAPLNLLGIFSLRLSHFA